ncbi:hypothetical protein Hdeb2414_s0003g00098391 [Helianthus debilis subsp. tardiflorus]
MNKEITQLFLSLFTLKKKITNIPLLVLPFSAAPKPLYITLFIFPSSQNNPHKSTL